MRSSKVERFYTYFVTFSLGAIACGLALSWSACMAEFRGHSADWFAAAGTWVIGILAWKYSKNAHELQAVEVEQSRLAKLEERLLKVESLRAQLNGMSMHRSLGSRLAQALKAPPKPTSFTTVMSQAKFELSNNVLSPDHIAAATDEVAVKCMEFQKVQRYILARLGNMIAFAESGRERWWRPTSSIAVRTRVLTGDLEGIRADVERMLNAHVAKLRTARDESSERLRRLRRETSYLHTNSSGE